MEEIIVISVGGSLIVPREINTAFLEKFKEIISQEVKKGKKFILIAGGGRTARNYQQAVSSISKLTRDDLDWLGIHATRLNGHLLRTIFRKMADPEIITNPHKDIKTDKPIVIGAGWRPGRSTDYEAVVMAKRIGAKIIVNLSNIDYVYNKDPKKHPDAKSLEQISWEDFQKLVGDKWHPGLNAPFDPVASRLARAYSLSVAILNGNHLGRLVDFFQGNKFKGTVIK